MMRALLDINVLLALFDSDHVDHTRTRDWLGAEIGHGWASCAITQNGFMRVITSSLTDIRSTPIKTASALTHICISIV